MIFTALLLVRATCADVLPDDRADIFYSKYSGGGMDITGESALVRKKFTENFAVKASYFVDKVSGASIDVLSQASQIKDERKQKSATVEYVHDKTTYTASIINSVERDYKSDTGSFSLKQDMFGDLTTLSLAFSNTNDTVGENNGTAFVPVINWLGHAESRSYNVDLSQILTKNFIAGVNFNVITDQGYLANPYRSVRYLNPTNAKGYSLASQVYKETLGNHRKAQAAAHSRGISKPTVDRQRKLGLRDVAMDNQSKIGTRQFGENGIDLSRRKLPWLPPHAYFAVSALRPGCMKRREITRQPIGKRDAVGEFVVLIFRGFPGVLIVGVNQDVVDVRELLTKLPQQSDFVITHFRVQDVVPGIESGIVNVIGDPRDISRVGITIHIRRPKME